ncbi:MAG TPA: biotin/lipoyl-binding protein [Syntrophales bacterium]|nr:biotin/lipoyl-binding protein [Syntrophales bacterium]
MQYRFKTDEDLAVWTADPEGADRLTVTTGTQTLHVRHGAVSPHHLHLTVDGLGVNAFVWGGDGEKTVVIRGVPYPVQDADVAERKTRKKADRENLPQVVTPPMPSVVVRIPVSEGDRVCKGQAVIVLTAMKMETTLTAPFPGRVTKINVAEGEKVMPGRILVDIEKEAETDAPGEGRQAATGAPP